MPIERLGATRSFLREIIEAVPGAVYAKDREGRILLGNQAFAEAVGWPQGDFVGRNDLELLADKELARKVMRNDQRIMAGRTRCQVEEMLRSADGTTSHWLSTKAPLTDESGNVVGLVGVSIDITERKRLEERERFLALEIEHRNKNLLSVVQSILRQTSADNIEAFREAVVGRLEALSRVQGVLVREHHQQVKLQDLLLEELSAYDVDTAIRVRLIGPPVYIVADTVQPLAMTFHELATNAAKYGAFAGAEGELDVTWNLVSDQLAIEWRERGGPPVATPAQQGFGTRLVTAMVEHQLKGTLIWAWEPGGLCCQISLPSQVMRQN